MRSDSLSFPNTQQNISKSRLFHSLFVWLFHHILRLTWMSIGSDGREHEWARLFSIFIFAWFHFIADDANGHFHVSHRNKRGCTSGWKLLYDLKVSTMSSALLRILLMTLWRHLKSQQTWAEAGMATSLNFIKKLFTQQRRESGKSFIWATWEKANGKYKSHPLTRSSTPSVSRQIFSTAY